MSEYTLNDGSVVELQYEHADYLNVEYDVVDDLLIIGHLSRDEDVNVPNEEFDGEGEVILFRRDWSRDKVHEGLAAIGFDEDGPDLDLVGDDITLRKFIDALSVEQVRRWVLEYSPETMEEDGTFSFGKAKDLIFDDLHSWPIWRVAPDGDAADWEKLYDRVAYKEWRRRLDAGEIGNKYAKLLDIYEHSGMHISLSDTREYPDEQWDVARGGGVWVPGRNELKNIEAWARRENIPIEVAAQKYAESCIETYNQYLSGDVWCMTIEQHKNIADAGEDPEWEFVENLDNLCGMWGSDYAEKEMKSQVAAEIERLKKRGE